VIGRGDLAAVIGGWDWRLGLAVTDRVVVFPPSVTVRGDIASAVPAWILSNASLKNWGKAKSP
jgi:hypothetical protein